MKRSYLILLFALTFSAKVFSQTTLTEDANGVLNATKIVTQTSGGQIFYTGHQLGSGYSMPSGIFRAWTDNPNGVANYFYDGVTNGTTTYSVRADGQGYFATNVGVGTTSPTAKLQIGAGTSNNGSTVAMFSGVSAGGWVNALSLVNAATPGTANEVDMTFHTSGSYSPTAKIGAIAEATQPTTDLVFSTYSSTTALTEKMRILGNGSVGIGTAAPGSYLLAVSGGIHAKQVNIDMTGWSDYVFKPTYHLPSLSEVKAYVDLNHHLPEIPSEQEIKTDGLNLGDIDRLLTKKVEELTLYLIEKDKQLNDEKEINGKQQGEINLQTQQLELTNTQLQLQDARIRKLEEDLAEFAKGKNCQ